MADAAEHHSTAADGTLPGARALVDGARVAAGGAHHNLLGDVELAVNVDLGRTRMTIRDILALTRGSVVHLNKLSGEAVDVCIQEQLLALGEVIVIQDKLRIRVLDLIYPPDQQEPEPDA